VPIQLQFRSFRARVLTFVFGLLFLVQGAVLLFVNAAHVREARRHIDEALELTAGSFRQSLDSRQQILLEKARLLSSDFAFKEARATADHATLLSALENHRERIGADVMMLLGTDASVLADTLHPERKHARPALRPLIAEAMDSEFGEACAIHPIDGTPYQLVVVPLFTPEPSAWIAIGFLVSDGFARELGRQTRTQVSLLWREAAGWRSFASTLAPATRRALEEELPAQQQGSDRSEPIQLLGMEFVYRLVPVPHAAGQVVAVLQRPLDEALRPFMRLRSILLLVFASGLALSLMGGVLLAARVTRPVAKLTRGAQRIAEGDYVHPVVVSQRDEFGSLATSFNHMMKGLAERDRVRDMLGKVVSPEIAEELLRQEIELGGEERTVSMLFTDIRGFASVAERESPQRLVRLLNTYLGWVGATVERHGGVVEQYVGDAVMALFGAPLEHDDDALRSVRVAMELCGALPDLNAEITSLGYDPLTIGVGIHTGLVVAGNMGSPSRLNYGVVGDAVNLASRLEGLTKRYRVGAIVSESTREGCTGIAFRELDRVRVKGRQSPVRIYQPMGIEDALSAEVVELLALHRKALQHYRARDWSAAEAIFRKLRECESGFYDFYLERTALFRCEPPGSDWDGTTTFDEK
jgi:adenylate cyclase